MPKGLPLDEQGRNELKRDWHDLIIDRKIRDEQLLDGGLRDDAIYIVEKPCYFTQFNITPEDSHRAGRTSSESKDPSEIEYFSGLHFREIGDHVTDVDFMEYIIPENQLNIREIKGVRPPADMSEEEKLEEFDEIEKGHDQISSIIDKLGAVEDYFDVDYKIDHGVETWYDVFDSNSFNDEEIPAHRGKHILSQNAYDLYQESREAQALDAGLFAGRMLLNGERIRIDEEWEEKLG